MNLRWFDFEEFILDRMQIRSIRDPDGDRELTVDCPSCGDTKHFDFSIAKQLGNCYKCQFTCNGLQFIMAVEGCDRAGAIELAFKSTRIVGSGVTPAQIREAVENIGVLGIDPILLSHDLPPEFIPVIDRKKRQAELPLYLKQRRIDLKTAAHFRMGFCRIGKYGGRVVIPIRCAGVKSFVARDMTGTQPKKYLNPGQATFGSLLFNYDDAKSGKAITLVEGVFDAIRVWQAGVNVCALFGKKVSDGQLNLLLNSNASEVNIMLDDDARNQAVSIARQLDGLLRVFVVRTKAGADPGSMEHDDILKAISRRETAIAATYSNIRERLALI